MPAETQTNIAVAEVDGEPSIIWLSSSRTRTPVVHDQDSSSSPFDLFINARNLDEMLVAIERLENERSLTYLPFNLPRLESMPSPCRKKATAIASLFKEDGESPTHTDVRRANAAIASWGLSADGMRPALAGDMLDTSNGRTPSFAQYMPISDCVQMAMDVRNACGMAVCASGGCSVNDILGYSRYVKSHDERLSSAPILEEQYRVLAGGNESVHGLFIWPSLLLPFDGSAYFDMCDDGIAVCSSMMQAARGAFNLALSGCSPRLNDDMLLSSIPRDLLSSIWLHYATRLHSGGVAVCPYCHRIFTRTNGRKIYHSESCKQQASNMARKSKGE